MTGLRRASLFLSQHSFPFQAFQTKQRFDIIIIRINNSSKSMIASAKLFDFFLISNFLCKKHRKINYNISLQI